MDKKVRTEHKTWNFKSPVQKENILKTSAAKIKPSRSLTWLSAAKMASQRTVYFFCVCYVLRILRYYAKNKILNFFLQIQTIWRALASNKLLTHET